MENIGDRQYGLSIDGDVFHTVLIPGGIAGLSERFFEGFKESVQVLDVTDNLPIGIGWELNNGSFVNNASELTVVDSLSSGQRLYAFLANNKIFGMIEPRLSSLQKEMFSAAFSTGGVVGVNVT
jgi:hypothetical protein